jgi:hypothetical protein
LREAGIEGVRCLLQRKNIKRGKIYRFLIFLRNYTYLSDVFKKLGRVGPPALLGSALSWLGICNYVWTKVMLLGTKEELPRIFQK